MTTTQAIRTQGGTRHGQVAVRVCWVVVAIVVLNLFMFGAPLRYAQLSTLPPTSLVDLAWLGLTPPRYALLVVGMEGLVVAGFALAAMLLFWHRSDDPMVLFVALMLLLLGVMNGIFVRSPWTLAALHPALALLLRLLTCATYTLFVLFFFLFPDGHFTPPRCVWLAAPLVIIVAVWVLAPGTDFLAVGSGIFRETRLPVTIPLLGALVGVQLYRYLRISNETQRQQTRWVVFGLAGSAIVFLEAIFMGQGVAARTHFSVDTFQLISNLFASCAVLLIPGTFGLAVTRSHLFDIELLLNRAVVYSMLTAGVVVSYALLVGLFSQLFQTKGNFLISLVATGAVAVAFQPMKDWLRRAVNRLMFGERDDPYAVLARLGQRLNGAIAPAAVFPTIVETVRDALRVPYVAIALQQHDRLVVVAATGTPGALPVAWPLVYQQETVGELLVAPRSADESFSPADRRLLDDLTRQAGVAAYAVRLSHDLQSANDDLQQSRRRLITLREEERRRIRRDLHDGLGPALASVTFTVEAARNLLQRDVARVDSLLATVTATTQQAITDIRRVVDGLRPPALDQLGLSTALREAAAAYQASGLQIIWELEADLPPLPAAIEVAVYRILQEALTNVTKHARAHTCRIVLCCSDAVLRLTISDDGVGLPATRPVGVGLQSMRERAVELGGRCTIDGAPGGGTRVQAELLLPQETVTA